uniref:uncharacterized protein LOC122596795 n=1 Tax=Erigeron canadensis TaxID=72917 RepID=UPI001CB9A20F|nr:uncharacterized protein LOC122596795 [Erigeron canadensis]
MDDGMDEAHNNLGMPSERQKEDAVFKVLRPLDYGTSFDGKGPGPWRAFSSTLIRYPFASGGTEPLSKKSKSVPLQQLFLLKLLLMPLPLPLPLVTMVSTLWLKHFNSLLAYVTIVFDLLTLDLVVDAVSLPSCGNRI